ncbi:MAG: hypothetical protein ABSG27_12210 [Candidatus Acidiferrales bacterium]
MATMPDAISLGGTGGSKEPSRTRLLHKRYDIRWGADPRIIYSQWTAKRGNGPILAAPVLAEAVLFLHLLWYAWVLLGWTVTRCRRLLRTLHVASLIHAIIIELVPWPPCPLTVVALKLHACSHDLIKAKQLQFTAESARAHANAGLL